MKRPKNLKWFNHPYKRNFVIATLQTALRDSSTQIFNRGRSGSSTSTTKVEQNNEVDVPTVQKKTENVCLMFFHKAKDY